VRTPRQVAVVVGAAIGVVLGLVAPAAPALAAPTADVLLDPGQGWTLVDEQPGALDSLARSYQSEHAEIVMTVFPVTTPPGVEVLFQALSKFKRLAESHRVDEILAAATSATREARNGGEFLARIERETSIRPRVISGVEEARLIHQAAVYGVDVKTHSSAESIRAGLVKQLYTPVYWAATVRTMIAAGATQIVECGPGKILTGLNRRVDKNRDLKMMALEDPDGLDEALAAVKH
jgi:hypothetical protein